MGCACVCVHVCVRVRVRVRVRVCVWAYISMHKPKVFNYSGSPHNACISLVKCDYMTVYKYLFLCFHIIIIINYHKQSALFHT